MMSRNVLRKIEHYHQGSIAGFSHRVLGFFDGIQWDGRSALFFALRETDEAQARIKLLARE